MSIAAMTEIAFQRRSDVGAHDYFPKTLREIAGAAGGKGTPETDVNTALRTLTNYVPTEVLTVYVAVVAAIQPAQSASASAINNPGAHWVAFVGFLLVTPLVVWLVYAAKVKSDGKPIPAAPRNWPIWEMIAGTIGYAAWAFALPNSPFSSASWVPWYSPSVAGVVVLVTSTLLGLLAPL
jgi:hypothetical protein